MLTAQTETSPDAYQSFTDPYSVVGRPTSSGAPLNMARRRQSSTKPVRDRASDDGGRVSASVLADRIILLEGICDEMKRTLDVQFHRIAAIQAQLDHMVAKVSGR